jgi:hypothetical protein
MPTGLLRLDERIRVHRVSRAKNPVAHTSCRSRRFSAAAGSARPARRWSARPSGSGDEFDPLDPLAHRGLGQVDLPRDLTDRAVCSLLPGTPGPLTLDVFKTSQPLPAGADHLRRHTVVVVAGLLSTAWGFRSRRLSSGQKSGPAVHRSRHIYKHGFLRVLWKNLGSS